MISHAAEREEVRRRSMGTLLHGSTSTAMTMRRRSLEGEPPIEDHAATPPLGYDINVFLE